MSDTRKTKAELTAELATWKSRATTIKNEYDVLRSNRLRRTPQAERKDEAAIYKPSNRAKGSNIGRDLERNYASARGIIHQFRMNVVGSLGKLQVNVEGGKEASYALPLKYGPSDSSIVAKIDSLDLPVAAPAGVRVRLSGEAAR